MKLPILLFIFIYSFLSLNIIAGTEKVKSVPAYDTIYIKAWHTPANTIAQFKRDPAFLYNDDKPVDNSFWKMLLYKISRLFANIAGNGFSEILFFIVFIGIFIIILIKLLGADVQALLSKNKNHPNIVKVNIEDNIENFDFESAIKLEMEAGHFNMAVRYLFLKLLQGLTHQNLIIWQKEKTNREYLRELMSTPYSFDFKAITNTYEYFWYGQFPLDIQEFNNIHTKFNDFFSKLNAE